MPKKKLEHPPIKQAAPPGQATPLKLVWQQTDDLEAIFADNLHLGIVNNQFYLTFGQIIPHLSNTAERE